MTSKHSHKLANTNLDESGKQGYENNGNWICTINLKPNFVIEFWTTFPLMVLGDEN